MSKQQQFHLDQHEVSITNINWRTERHGEERVRAVDIACETTVENTLLDELAPGLKESFYRKPSKGEQQELPNVPGTKLTQVTHPFLGVQKLPHEFEGYELTIDGLLEHIDPMFLADVKLKKFAFEAKEGGMAVMTFTAQASHISSEDLVELDAAQLREKNRITLTPPAQQELPKAA